MPHLRTIRLLTLAWLAPAVVAGQAVGNSENAGLSAGQSRAAPSLIVTRQNTFGIPFKVSTTAPGASVELYVSQDTGKTWRLHARQPTTQPPFRFRAPLPGEYWFASRLVPKDRIAEALDQLRPELHILIDVDEPQLSFESKVGPAGKIVSQWQVSDAALDPNSLKLEYQTHPSQPWRPVPLHQHQGRVQGNTMIGKMSWVPQDANQAIQVRAEVIDRAGNKAVVNRVVLLPLSPAQNEDPRGIVNQVPADPFRDAQQFADHAITWPKDNRLPLPSLPTAAPPSTERYVHRLDPTKTVANEIGPARTAVPFRKPSPLADRTRVVSQFAGQRAAKSSQRGSLPAGASPRMTRSSQFQLDYIVEAIQSAGIQKVELWGTSDFGSTWSVWQLDEDRTSPIEITVEDEGIYGFEVVVVAKNGLAGSAPRNGDPAELWVAVDGTDPTLRIESAAYGDDQHFGQLDIRWTADDEWISDRPITLLYSDQPTGPWTTIRSAFENTGQHYWPVDPRVPAKIYLRIEARDDAGNVGTFQLAEPINTAGLTPEAHIQGIRPTQR